MKSPVQTLFPMPRSVQSDGETVILLCRQGMPQFHLERIECDHPVFSQAAALFQNSLQDQGCQTPVEGKYPIRLRVDPSCPFLAGHAVADAYAILMDDEGIDLIGYDAGGAFYAVQTFAQLLVKKDGNLYVMQAQIVDWPSFPTRGLFLEDRYGSDFLTREDWFRAIDYFAKMKLNSLTVGIYGCWCQQFDSMISEFLLVPFRKYPQLRTPRHVKYYSVSDGQMICRENVLPVMFEADYFGDLIAYAKQRNIIIKPLFNSYGHNTLIPRLFPALSAKDEQGNDTGFGVCTASEKTYDIMFDLYDEIIDRYLAPHGIDAIHIGLDEVWEGIGMDAVDPFKFHTPFCRCEKCRNRERSELMIEYIIRICRHLKEKGMRSVYIYQDMLQYEFDVLDEKLAQRLRDEGLYDTVVIDWWNYAHESQLFRGRELNSCFRSIIKSFTGYYHWSQPMEYLSNIRGCTRLAIKHGFEGIEAYSALESCHDRSYQYVAELAWNTDTLEDQQGFLDRYAARSFPGTGERGRQTLEVMTELQDALRQDGVIGAKAIYGLDYYNYTYVKADKPYPRPFPEEVFAKLHGDQTRYCAAFRRIRAQAQRALRFFEDECANGRGEKMLAMVWRAIALHYQVVADEYLGLMALETEKDARAACVRIQALLDDRENLMRVAGEVRVPANQFMYLRIQSIYRQVLVDLLVYAKKCADAGEEFHLDMTNLQGITGETLRQLR